MKKAVTEARDKKAEMRIIEANSSLKKLMRDILPFIQSRKLEKRTSAGQWIDSESIRLTSVSHKE